MFYLLFEIARYFLLAKVLRLLFPELKGNMVLI